MALELIEPNRALSKVEDPSQMLAPHHKSAIHELVTTDALPKLLFDPSVRSAATLPAAMDNLDWKFGKVVSSFAAAHQITTEQAHKRVGIILVDHATRGVHYNGGTLHMCEVTGNITVRGDVKVSGIGLNRILGFDNGPFGLAWNEYIYKCVVALAKDLDDSRTYKAKEDQMHGASTAAFNKRKGKMLELGVCGSPPVAQAAGMRNDKASYQAILNLPPRVTATQAKREAGITDKKTIAKSLNCDAARRLKFLRDEIGMNQADNPHASPDAVADIVIQEMGQAYTLKDMQTRRPIGYKKQSKRMFSKKLSKRSLQDQNLLL